MILFSISFIAGVLTVLAPCILPLLPVIIGGSLSGDTTTFNKKKAFTIILSLGISVIAFTLLLKVSTLFIHIPEYVWTWISGGIIVFFGLVTLFPRLWESRLLAKVSTKSNILIGKGLQKKSFWGDVIMGAALGPVFSTCSPTYFIVLATVLPVSPALGLFYLLAYTFGLCLSLFLVSIIGQKILNRLGVAANPKGWFKKTLGILFVIVGIAILFGLDKKAQLFLLESGIFDVTKIEQKLLQENPVPTESTTLPNDQIVSDTTPSSETITDISNDTTSLTPTNTPSPMNAPTQTTQATSFLTLQQKQAKYKKVPELSTIDGYINTDGTPLTLESLKGKVVLLDIWTYSCINCQRTLPYLTNWYTKYKDQRLVIVGLHTPEFSFERVQANVEKAVAKFGITYPVVLDNDYSTWNALGNQFWPRKYLIDIDGYIVYDHAGEGNYAETEKAIQTALKERADRMGMKDAISKSISTPSTAISFDDSRVKSPEIYFGSSRNEHLGNGTPFKAGQQNFIVPSSLLNNTLYLSGTWNITPEYAESKSTGSIVFKYEAKNVYLTAGASEPIEVQVYKDDVLVKTITVQDQTLYPLIQDTSYKAHTLRIVVPKSSLQAFTFTFG